MNVLTVSRDDLDRMENGIEETLAELKDDDPLHDSIKGLLCDSQKQVKALRCILLDRGVFRMDFEMTERKPSPPAHSL